MSKNREVRTRFAPSPTGDLHVGNIRTALFDWAYARHTGGKLIFRIEDTDRERVTDEYIQRAIDTLKWLGLNWDEGPEVDGPYGPYLQSQRLDIYDKWAKEFLKNGRALVTCSTSSGSPEITLAFSKKGSARLRKSSRVSARILSPFIASNFFISKRAGELFTRSILKSSTSSSIEIFSRSSPGDQPRRILTRGNL